MSSLNNNYINKTFNSLLKLFNNESFTGTTKHTISDGLGNVLPISFDVDGTTVISGTTKANKFIGGFNTSAGGDGTFVGGGLSNDAAGQCSSVVGGENNTVFREYSSVLGGKNNTSNEAYSMIGGGLNNTTEGQYSGILGGQNNYTDLSNTFIIGSNITATTENTTYVENISIGNTIYDSNGNQGTNGQILYKVDNGLEWLTVDLNALTGDTVSKEVFYQYTSDTNTLIGTKLNITDFSSYSSTTNSLIGGKLNITDFNSYSSTTKTQIDSKVIEGGGNGSTIRINNNNQVQDQGSSVLGGCNNTSCGNCSVIVGGNLNITSSAESFIGGGSKNTAASSTSTISGGYRNTTFNYGTFIGGGIFNTASGDRSVIGGGDGNKTNGACSTISGGRNNSANCNYSNIIGGCGNIADHTNTFILGSNITTSTQDTTYVQSLNIKNNLYDNDSSSGGVGNILSSTGSGTKWRSVDNLISGSTSITRKLDTTIFAYYTANTSSGTGYLNSAFTETFASYTAATKTQIDSKVIEDAGSGATIRINNNNRVQNQGSSVLGGCCNTSLGNYSTVLGGLCNTNNANCSVIGGGCRNTSCNVLTFIGGGSLNTALSSTSTISGGFCNVTCGYAASVGGGIYNTAEGDRSVVAGGDNNVSIGNCSAILGGSTNLSYGTYSTISGGYGNQSVADYSSIINGSCNYAYCNYSNIMGGCGNTATHTNTFILGSNITTSTQDTTYVENLNIKNNLYDCTTSSGSAGNILSSTGSGTKWRSVDNLISGSTSVTSKLNISDFNIYSSTTNTRINNKLNTSDFNIYSSTTNTRINNKVETSTYNSFVSSTNLSIGNLNSGLSTKVIEDGGFGNGSTIRINNANQVQNEGSSVLGGCNNTSCGNFSTISGGQNNATCDINSSIGGGINNTTIGRGSVIAGGRTNSASGCYSGILGGSDNCTNHSNTFILGSNITTSTPDTTYVQSLNVKNNLYDCTASSGSAGYILSSTGSGTLWGSVDSLISNSSSITSKLNISDFNTYSSTTNTRINNKYDKAGGIISGSVYIQGDLFIAGTANTVNQQSITVQSPIIVLASGSTLPTLNAGLLINRAVTGSTAFIYKEDLSEFQLGYTTAKTVTNVINFDTYGKLRLGSLYTTNIYDKSGSSGLVDDVLFSKSDGVQWGNLNYKLNVSDFNTYSSTTNTLIGTKLNISDFNTYSSATNSLIGTKLNISDFNTYSSTTNNLIGTKLNITDFNSYSSNTLSTFTSFTNSFYSYSSNTKTTIDGKLNISDFNTYSSTTNNIINNKLSVSGGTVYGDLNVLGNVTANTFYGIGGYTTLGTPTDGGYDTGILGLTSATTINNAVDAIDEILALLAPAKPSRLDASSWISPGYSSAKGSRDWPTGISGQTISNIIFSNSTPSFRVTGGTSGTNTGFWNGVSGTLNFYVNGNPSPDGTKTLTGTVSNSSINNGSNGGLTITDNDYYLNQTGKSGFWAAINATGRTSNTLDYNVFTSQTYTLTHSETGTLSTSFYVDDPQTPSVTTPTQSGSLSMSRYISGVPSLAAGNVININYTVNNAISKFYTSGTFATLTPNSVTNGDWGSVTAYVIPSPPLSGASISLTNQTITVNDNRYSDTSTTLSTTATAYNAKGTSSISSSLSLSSYRIDTVSNENRLRAAGVLDGNPTFYPIDFGGSYNSAEIIVNNGPNDPYNYELQLLGGSYQVPLPFNYSPYGGPDYSSLIGSYNRFVLLTGSPLNTVRNVTITFNGTSGDWTASPNGVTSGLYLNVKVGGTGWIDGNLPYPGGGSPSSDGDPAMNASPASTATLKQITFGSIDRSGTIYVRIGLPAGSTKKFTGITIS